MSEISSVKVAVRIRPHIQNFLEFCHSCITVNPNEPQIWLGKDKAFTFDEVFNMHTTQQEIYDKFVKSLLDGCFNGYNATVLAYGQTGSGKTYTMGTGFDIDVHHTQQGIIPRAVYHLFKEISKKKEEANMMGNPEPEFKVTAQFIELYNEEVIDLLDTTRDAEDKNKRVPIKIHEDLSGGIYANGVITTCVSCTAEALECLKLGSLSRTTASTRMNSQSSRSHAIYTLTIKQKRLIKLKSLDEERCNSVNHDHNDNLDEYETLMAKFHFVDLAGSERLKRTQATGDRQKEAICINSGLLALGNVISALGDKSKKITHIPYRDSKLTRLLQDSLGGNSHTFMICCISPSDQDFMETLNTLKYANRAKNIKNKVSINLDKTSYIISSLRQELENTKSELLEYKQGKRIVNDDGTEYVNDMYHENMMLLNENSVLKTRLKALKETLDHVILNNSELISEKVDSLYKNSGDGDDSGHSKHSSLVKPYILEIEKLRTKLMESEKLRSHLVKTYQVKVDQLTQSEKMTGSPSTDEVIELAKQDLKQLKRQRRLKVECLHEKESISVSDDEKDVDEKNELETDIDESSEEIDDDQSEFEGKQVSCRQELAELNNDISVKEKLIVELEKSQRRLHNMKERYEEKIIQLQNKISETEKERDKFLNSLRAGSTNSLHEEKTKKAKLEFEQKLKILKSDMKQIEAIKRDHEKYVRTRADHEQQLEKLRKEVSDMKQFKVSLINKIKDEAKKSRELEITKNKEIAQLKKDRNIKDNQIKNLEADKKAREAVLRRKQEEIMNLRKINKDNLQKKHLISKSGKQSSKFSILQAKQKWQNLEKMLDNVIFNKVSIFTIEKDMEHWLTDQEKLSRSIANTIKRKDTIILDPHKQDELSDVMEEIETLKENIKYVQENIDECQFNIMQLEESKDNIDGSDFVNLVQYANLEEAKYLLGKLCHMTIHQGFVSAQHEMSSREAEMYLEQAEHNNNIHEQLYLNVINQAYQHLIEREAERNQEIDNLGSGDNQHFAIDRFQNVGLSTRSPELQLKEDSDLFNVDSWFKNDQQVDSVTSKIEALIIGAFNDGNIKKSGESFGNVSATFNEYNTDIGSSCCVSTSTESYTPVGRVMEFHEKSSQIQTSRNITCTHIAEGHEGGVVSLECTDDVLFSSSIDSTVKVWDLRALIELQQLVGHPNAVVKVKYCEYTRLAFTASLCYIKLWDMRLKHCIHTLCSSGQKQTSDISMSKNVIPFGEKQINDIGLNHYGTMMFSTFANAIRIWDLKMFQSVSLLDAGFLTDVTCLAVDESKMDKNFVISGDKDNSIKVFEVDENTRGKQYPQFSLTPPHCGGIQSFALSGDDLFSFSKDKSIKKWNLRKRCLEKVISYAHEDVPSALNVLPSGSLLLSGCHSGYLGLWSPDTCTLVEKLRAHDQAINFIASNNSCMFTASKDKSIGIWKLGNANSAVLNERY